MTVSFGAPGRGAHLEAIATSYLCVVMAMAGAGARVRGASPEAVARWLTLGGVFFFPPCSTGQSAMSEGELEALRGVFALFDTDGTGSIDASEFSALLEKVGRDPAEGTWQRGASSVLMPLAAARILLTRCHCAVFAYHWPPPLQRRRC